MKLLLKNQLISHDVYEFCYNIDYPNHWNNNSIFLHSDDMAFLSPYIDKIISDFHYYGVQKMTISNWDAIQKQCLSDTPELTSFFQTIEQWIQHDPQQNNYFWIFGI